jgi:hypothetical protein
MYTSDTCGIAGIQPFFACASHQLDNTACCEQAGINAHGLPKECMNMCHTDIATVQVTARKV